jgi:hypothetical protein
MATGAQLASSLHTKPRRWEWKALLGGLFLWIMLPVPDLIGLFVPWLIDGRYSARFRTLTGISVTLMFIVTVAARGLLLWAYARWARRRNIFGLKFQFSRGTGVWMAVAMLISSGLIVIDQMTSTPGIHVPLLRAFSGYWGFGFGLTNTVLQYVYYVSEGLALVWMADAFQIFGDAYQTNGGTESSHYPMPWAGIALALLWAVLGHAMTKDLMTGLAIALTGYCIGAIYTLSRKQVWPALAVFIIMCLPELF